MDNLYERTIELLNTSNQDDLFRQFIIDVGENPSWGAGYFGFEKHGFDLWCLSKTFRMVSFQLNTAAEANGAASFKGELPFGIKIGDMRSDVQDKFGTTPLRTDLSDTRDSYQTRNVRDYFDLPPLMYIVSSSGATEQVLLLTVVYNFEELSSDQIKEQVGFRPAIRRRTRSNSRGQRHR